MASYQKIIEKILSHVDYYRLTTENNLQISYFKDHVWHVTRHKCLSSHLSWLLRVHLAYAQRPRARAICRVGRSRAGWRVSNGEELPSLRSSVLEVRLAGRQARRTRERKEARVRLLVERIRRSGAHAFENLAEARLPDRELLGGHAGQVPDVLAHGFFRACNEARIPLDADGFRARSIREYADDLAVVLHECRIRTPREASAETGYACVGIVHAT